MQKTEVKSRFTPPTAWHSTVMTNNPIFADLCQRFGVNRVAQWPDVGWLNSLATQVAVKFVENDALMADGRYYEEYIYATAQVPTRKDNWHDFFGALIWCLFPKTKGLLNQLHMAEIAEHGQKQRTKLRNKLTLFDECGVVICLEPDAIKHADLLRQHQWQQSFVTNRTDWWHSIKPLVFGHAIYEMATAPFIGLTAKALFVAVPQGFSSWPLTAAYSFIDDKLHEQIANQALLLDNQQLTPLPVLGVPGWYNDNNTASFYNNTDYFRPRRQQ